MSDIFLPQRAIRTAGRNGETLLSSPYPLRPGVTRTGDWLDHWAIHTPGAVFVAERSGDGWRTVTYAETLQRVEALAGALLGLGLRPDRPLMLLSGKGVDHAMLALAAQYVGIPSVAIAEQYSLIPAAHDKFAHVVSVVRPGAVFVDDSARFAATLSSPLLAGIPTIAAKGEGQIALSELLRGGHSAEVAAAKSGVTANTLAKLLFTSGSTSLPKAVRTTQRMLTSNQMQIAQVWPFLARGPQRIVDWLPWNHTFGGSHNFNLMLANGGALYIDDGQATESGIARTIENIRSVGQTISFNVPVAYSMMARAMRDDPKFRARFFEDLNLIFYAAASMPQAIWDALKEQALRQTGRAPEMAASWGMTETAPAGLMVHGPMKSAGMIGVPLPGVVAKLVPRFGDAWELRVTGPNVTDGYHNATETHADTFDDEGYLITGDVVRFVSPDDPSQGLLYDGRISEDFKLTTGTWVQVSKVRVAALNAMAPVVADLVICGHGMSEVGAMAFVDPVFRAKLPEGGMARDGVLTNPELLSALGEGLSRFAREGGGSSMRIARVIALADEPSLPLGEITQKGGLNQRLLLKTRASLVKRLFDDADPAIVRLQAWL